MLSAYFDESGMHDLQTGKLTRLTVAGALSTLGNWQRISAEWERALKENGINAFHMAPFEAYRGEFKDWSKLKHQTLLRCLLDIITSVPLIVVGAFCLLRYLQDHLSKVCGGGNQEQLHLR
jgi:hypothetical protein